MLVLRTIFFSLIALVAFLGSLPQLDRWPSNSPSTEMQVVLPRFVQIILAGGDRYLAANFGGIRALVSDTQRMDREAFHILGLVQQDVAWLNPAHEDNYYIAAGILPWNGELDAAQAILRQAIEARTFDMWPAFYYAFDLHYFKKDSVSAAQWLRLGATRTSDEHESLLLEDMASRWVRTGTDRKSAIGILGAMAKTARSAGFAAHLRKHQKRLENLLLIEDAAKEYREHHGRLPGSIELLVRESRIEGGLPVDPFGGRYLLTAQGEASVQERQR